MSELVSEALDLVLYGMGSVFVFLTLLVGATMLMSRLLYVAPVIDEPSTSGSNEIDPRILAAITVAVKKYRADH